MQGTEVGSLYYDLNIDDKNLKSQLANADSAVKGFGETVSQQWDNSVAASKRFMVGIGAATAGVIGFGVSSLKAYEDLQDAIAGMNAGLKNTGENVAVVSKKLQDQAAALQSVTKFSREQILSGDAMLTTFKLSGDSISKLNPVLLDMAEGLRDVNGNTIGLDEGAKLMGKAMGNAAGGVDGLATALRRNGVIMTEAQKQIFSTGTEAERTATLVQIMNDNFGGRALAAGKTLSGQLAILKNNFKDLQVGVGEVIAKALVPIVGRFSEVVKKIDEAGGILKMVQDFWKDHREAVILAAAAIGGILVPAIVSITAAFVVFLVTIAPWAAVGVGVVLLFQHFHVTLKDVEDILKKVKAKVEEFTPSLSQLKGWLDDVVNAIKNAWQWFNNLNPAIQLLISPLAFLFASFDLVKRIVTDLYHIFMDWFWPSIKAVGDAIIQNLWPALKQLWEALMRAWNAINPAFIDAVKILGAIIGVALVGAIWIFINVLNIVIQIFSIVVSAISNAINWISNLIGWAGTASINIIRFFSDIPAAIGAAFNGLVGIITYPFTEAFRIIKAGIKDVVDTFNRVKNDILGAPGKVFSGIGGLLSHIPGFAEGGIVPGPVGAPMLAVVHGGETVIPNGKQVGGPTFNIGQINNQQDEDWVLRRLNRDGLLTRMGGSPMGG